MRNNDPNWRRMMRNAAILLGAFLLGLIPVLIQNLQLKRELSRTQSSLALSETRDLASLAYLEASRNNFGLAAEHTSRLYERLGEMAANAEGPALSIAQDALAKRDALMGMLATADPAARTELQELTSRLHSAGSQVETRARAK